MIPLSAILAPPPRHPQAPCTLVKPTGVTAGTLYLIKGGDMVWEPAEGAVVDSDSLKVGVWEAQDA
jgi:hypothetical protein